MAWFIDLRQLPAGGDPVQDIGSIGVYQDDGKGGLPELLAAVRGKDVLLGTHGFAVHRAAGVKELSAWHRLLTLPSSAVFVAVLWPGDARIELFVDYPWEDDEAKASGALLAEFVNARFTGAASVSYCSHSLGARVVLEAVAGTALRIKRLVLMAGAVDDDCLHAQYAEAAQRVEEISVLASHCDQVLHIAFPLGNPIAGLLDVGHPYWSSALGRNGPDVAQPVGLQAGWLIVDAWDYGHLDYLGAGPKAMPLPVDIPKQGAAKPASKPSWSAAFVSSRFRRA
jgi:hypothetical protein